RVQAQKGCNDAVPSRNRNAKLTVRQYFVEFYERNLWSRRKRQSRHSRSVRVAENQDLAMPKLKRGLCRARPHTAYWEDVGVCARPGSREPSRLTCCLG